MTVYIDGVAVSTATAAASVTSLAGSVNYIGRDTNGAGSGDFYRGFMDDFAVWNVALSANDIRLLYGRQSAAYSGNLTSRVLTSPYQSAGTASMAWTTKYPSYKPLPSDAVSERADSYASDGNSLSLGLEYLWHLDETALGTVYGGDFLDDTGHGNTGILTTGYNGTATLGQPGLFNKALVNNGNCVTTTTYLNNPTVYTLSVWFNTSSSNGGKLIGFGNSQGCNSGSYDRHIYMGPDGLVMYGAYLYGFYTVTSKSALNDGRWHHAVATLSPTTLHSFYIDGVLQGTLTGVPANYGGYWHIAADNLGGWADIYDYQFYGAIDEVAIWNRNLSASEVLALYRRGGTRLKYRVRTCTNATCSDNQAWQGPDGTASTYFSELLNTSGTSTQNAWSPNLALATYPSLAINANQGYVQYQGIWESDDVNAQCTYNGVSAPCSAEDTNMIFNRVTYDTTSPSVTNANSISYYGLTSFAATLGNVGCPGGVTFTLSPDNATYYYYTGTAWASSNGTLAQTSTAAQLSASNLATYSSNYGIGKSYIRAYLTSSGTNPCTLQSVAINGNQ